jgi:cytoskeletal protein RodZ
MLVYDHWSLLVFTVIFAFIHVGFAIWLNDAYKKIRQLKKSELNFQKIDKDLSFIF